MIHPHVVPSSLKTMSRFHGNGDWEDGWNDRWHLEGLGKTGQNWSGKTGLA